MCDCNLEKSIYHLHSMLILLCLHFIPKLWGRRHVGNIVLSLQVVHRAEFWSPFKATPLWTSYSSCWAHPPKQGSDRVKSISHQACACTDSVANIVVKRCKHIWSYDLCELQAVIALWKWMWTIMSCGLCDANCNYSVTGLFLTICNSKTVGLWCSTYSSR